MESTHDGWALLSPPQIILGRTQDVLYVLDACVCSRLQWLIYAITVGITLYMWPHLTSLSRVISTRYYV